MKNQSESLTDRAEIRRSCVIHMTDFPSVVNRIKPVSGLRFPAIAQDCFANREFKPGLDNIIILPLSKSFYLCFNKKKFKKSRRLDEGR